MVAVFCYDLTDITPALSKAGVWDPRLHTQILIVYWLCSQGVWIVRWSYNDHIMTI